MAGIIAGAFESEEGSRAVAKHGGDYDEERYVDELISISGVAPRCKLLSLKVLDDNGPRRN